MVGPVTLMVDRYSAIYIFLRLHERNKRSGGGFLADDSFRRSLKRHVADVKNIAGVSLAMTRIDRSSVITKIYAYEIKQKPVEKHVFAVRQPPLWWHCALFFSYYHSQWLLFSPTKNNFSTTLTPTEKPRYTYWKVFFVDSIYSKTIDEKILIFYI